MVLKAMGSDGMTVWVAEIRTEKQVNKNKTCFVVVIVLVMKTFIKYIWYLKCKSYHDGPHDPFYKHILIV